ACSSARPSPAPTRSPPAQTHPSTSSARPCSMGRRSSIRPSGWAWRRRKVADGAMASERLERAAELIQRRRFDDSLLELGPLLAGGPEGADDSQRRYAYQLALKCVSRLGRWDQAEALGRQAIAEIPSFALAHGHLGEALVHLDRPGEAVESLA